jgi:hypothetical protein
MTLLLSLNLLGCNAMNMEAEESMAFWRCFQATTGEDSRLRRLSAAVPNFKVCKLMKMLQLILLKLIKSLVDPVTYPPHMYSHLRRDKI